MADSVFELDPIEAVQVEKLARKLQKAAGGQNGLRVVRACLTLAVATFKVTGVDKRAAHAILDEAFEAVTAGRAR